jgi:hydroxymethylpyrimidine kinase / phosphomethylpyrimidine kinase / thiamine-phosphate diphosphorylase
MSMLHRLNQTRPAAVVVDGAMAAAGSCSDILPGAAVVTCSLREARQWLGESASADAASVPASARKLRVAGAGAVCVVGVAGPDGGALDWLETGQACGWLRPGGAVIGGGELFGRHLLAAMGKGFVAADAAVLARMATTSRAGNAVEYVNDPAVLPQLSWGEEPRFAQAAAPSDTARRLDLYAIVDGVQRLRQVLAGGVKTVQLRIKAPANPDADWHAMLRREIKHAIAACEAAGAELFVNDYWKLAAEFGADGVHLGQEDLVALGETGRTALRASGLSLGLSSHSLWELCRARALAPRYIACGPVWPTQTKDMPWNPQGLDNLAWWCRMAQVPVVAIGGVLGAEQVRGAARSGADGVCIVRGLGDEPPKVLPTLQAALEAGRREYAENPMQPGWPHPSLTAGADPRPAST